MKRKLLILLCALLTSVGMWAYTTADLESAGWTLVTSAEGLTETNYYLFVDAETSEYAMARTTNSRPVYVKLADPFSATHQVWKLAKNDSKFYIQSNVDDYYFYSGNAGWNDNMSSSNKTKFTFIYEDSKWKINDERSGTEIYVGAWKGINWLTSKWYQSDNDSPGEDCEYQRVVSNKAKNNTGHFLIYSIPKTTFESKVRTVTTLTNAGWEKVTATSGLAKSDRYYLFLDDAFPCMAMTNTGAGRPKFKALGDPTTDNTSLWTTEENFSGYAIKNVERDKYLWTNVTWIWECNFLDKEGELEEGNAYQYAFTVDNGKWKIHSAVLNAEYYQGRWANSNDYPYETEDIASNKETNGVIQWAIYSIPKYLNDIEDAKPVTAGTYFLRMSDGKYMSRGSSYQTRTTADPWGLPITIENNDKGLRLKFADSNLYLYVNDSDNLYTDNDGTSSKSYWALVSTAGGYKLVCTESTVRNKYVVLSNGTFALASSGDPAVFTLEAAASHPAQMTALKNSQAEAVATAVGLEGVTTVAALSTAVSGWHTENISLTVAQNIGERYEDYDQGKRAWSDNIASETKTLSAGLYRLTVYGFHRMKSSADTYSLHTSGADSYTVALVAGNQSVQLCSLFDVASDTQWDGSNDYQGANNKYYPTNQTGAAAAYDAGKYLNTLYFYVDEDDTEVTVGIMDYGYTGRSTWTSYRGLTLTRIAKPYEALTAIRDTRKAERDAKTWGFDDGEYAPYNSAAMLADIKSADALIAANDLTLAQSTIDALTTRLTTTDTWGGANDGEVNAIYNWDMAITDGYNPKGWSREDNPWGEQKNNTEGYVWTAVSTNKTAWYYNNGGTAKSSYYGDTGSYTMPLKANTKYVLKVKYCSQGIQGDGLVSHYYATVQKGSDAAVLDEHDFGGNSTRTFVEKNVSFTTGDAGDYVLTLTNIGNIFFTDVSIMKYTYTLDEDVAWDPTISGTAHVKLRRKVVATDVENPKFNTVVFPFAMTQAEVEDFFGTGSKVYVVGNFESEDLGLNFAEQSGIVANKPCLVRATSTANSLSESYILKNRTLVATDGELADRALPECWSPDGTSAKMIGTYKDIFEVPMSDSDKKNYTVVNNYLFNVNSRMKMKGTRAYISIPQPGVSSARMDIMIDGEATAIDSIVAEETENDTLTDGKYLENGKIVIVKNGVKYSANGQIIK